MKTKLFLIVTIFISAITFSQTSRKGYNSDDYNYKNSSNTKMNKGELVHVIAKNTNKSRKGAARKNRRSQLFSVKKSSKFNVKQEFGPTKAQQRRQRPFDEKREQGHSDDHNLRIRPIDEKREMGVLPKGKNLRKKPGRTKFSYDSSKSNKNSNH